MEKRLFNKKVRLVFSIIIIATILYMAVKNTIIGNRETDALRKEYPNVISNNIISGIVKSNFSNRGALYISLEKNNKFCFSHSRNFDYDPPYLEEFVKNGDSVLKKAYSDTLYIYRENKEYYFIIGEFIGKDPKKRLFNVKQ